ncbi:hypothetical protein [Microcoleus sp. BROC3]
MDAQTWFYGRKDFVAALAPGKKPGLFGFGVQALFASGNPTLITKCWP